VKANLPSEMSVGDARPQIKYQHQDDLPARSSQCTASILNARFAWLIVDAIAIIDRILRRDDEQTGRATTFASVSR
jgi:hypothetical protein